MPSSPTELIETIGKIELRRNEAIKQLDAMLNGNLPDNTPKRERLYGKVSAYNDCLALLRSLKNMEGDGNG